MTVDDTEVLALLRTQANEKAPALTLQADAVMRTGRRHQWQRRLLGACGGIAVGAALVVAAIAFTGSDRSSSPAPADGTTTSPQTPFDPHAMPAILKQAALPPFDELPKWKTFEIAAFDGQSGTKELRESQWQQGSTWVLSGLAGDGVINLTVAAADPTTQGVTGEAFCASASDIVASTCEHDVLPDGRVVVQMWLKPMTDPSNPDLIDAQQWRGRAVNVYDPATGFSVYVREAAPASTIRQATQRLWLTPDQLVQIAADPILDLDGVLPQPSVITQDP